MPFDIALTDVTVPNSDTIEVTADATNTGSSFSTGFVGITVERLSDGVNVVDETVFFSADGGETYRVFRDYTVSGTGDYRVCAVERDSL